MLNQLKILSGSHLNKIENKIKNVISEKSASQLLFVKIKALREEELSILSQAMKHY